MAVTFGIPGFSGAHGSPLRPIVASLVLSLSLVSVYLS